MARADEGSIKFTGRTLTFRCGFEASPQTLTETFSDRKRGFSVSSYWFSVIGERGAQEVRRQKSEVRVENRCAVLAVVASRAAD